MKSKILTVLSVIFGLLLINSGLDKHLHYMPIPEGLPEEVITDGAALMEIEWLIPLIGLAEIIGGLLIIFPKTRALGAVVIFPVMVGVLLTHIFVAPAGLPIALALWAILLWILFDNRRKYTPMIST